MNMYAATTRLDEIMQALQDYDKRERPCPPYAYDLGVEFLRIAALAGSLRSETGAINERCLTFTLAGREVYVYDLRDARGWLRSSLARLAVLTNEYLYPNPASQGRILAPVNLYGFEATFNYPTPQGKQVPFHIETCNGAPKVRACGTYFFDLKRLDAYNYAF